MIGNLFYFLKKYLQSCDIIVRICKIFVPFKTTRIFSAFDFFRELVGD